MGFGRSRSQSIKVFDAHGKVVMPITMTLAVIGLAWPISPMAGSASVRQTASISASM
jgi:hypothetical protein